MTPTEILKAAKAKISTPSHWTQGAYARDDGGVWIHEQSPNAVCWCSMGAVYAVDADAYEAEIHLLNAVEELLDGNFGDVVRFNDADVTTHADVMAAFDKAIELAEEALKMPIKPIPARVADGVKYLDKFVPEWWNIIDLDRLSLSDTCNCVLGQLVTSTHLMEAWGYLDCIVQPWEQEDNTFYQDRLKEKQKIIAAVGFDSLITTRQAQALGFHMPNSVLRDLGDEDYEENYARTWGALTDEWRRVILERREQEATV